MYSGSIYFRCRDKTFKLNNHLLTFLPSSRRYFRATRWMRLKSLSLTSTFKVFRVYYFFAQFSLDSFCFVWNPLNLKLSRRPYCSRSSNFLAFILSCVSKYTILPSNEETYSSSLAMFLHLL